MVIAVALALSAPAQPRPTTTAPTKKVTVSVLITERGILLRMFGEEADGHTLDVITGPVPRGNYLSFNVLNRGNKQHDFVAFGKKTRSLKPGQKAHLFVTALTRGRFLYRSTLDKSKSFRGYITIY
jgi:hypothetical protein